MKFFKTFLLIFIIDTVSGVDSNLLLKDKYSPNYRNLDFHTIIGLMVDFSYEEINDPNTTGRGHFLNEVDSDLISSRCDGFLVDPPPHNADYFIDQIQAVKNYYSFNISNDGEDIFDFYVIDEIFHLDKPMRDYSISDNSIGNLFTETIDLALSESSLLAQEWFDEDEIENYLFVVFHAGVGQDISFPYIDPTNYDIPSAYIDNEMIDDSWSYYNTIQHGIVMPETLNHIYYNIIEDLFYGNDNFCNYQLGMTGLFSLLIGYAMDLPILYNTDNGDAGVGSFGLMDYGSNNGFGVMPAPISPWSKIYKGWSTSSNISEFGQIALDINDINRINISDSEYLLAENKNNWIQENIDLDSLRNKYKNWNSSIQDSIPGYFFDVLTERLNSNQIEISENTNVILGFDNYNYGLPGSGILIWSINEDLIDLSNVQSGINNNSKNKAIEIKEADGSHDIGQDCYHWNPSFCDILTKGWEYDLWYDSNDQYLINNTNETDVKLNDNTYPNLRPSDNSLSLIEFDNFSSIDNSMHFNYSSNTPLFSVSYISSNSEIEIIGSGQIEDKGCLYYLENNVLYQKCFGEVSIVYDEDFNPNVHSKVLVYNNTSYLASEDQYLSITDSYPIIANGLDDLEVFGYFNSTNYTEPLDNCFSAGDFDNDGLDECVFIENQNLHVRNSNNTSINNFPLDILSDNYENNILIANIVDDETPEIIFKTNSAIYIVSSTGETYASIATSNQSKLRLLPNWGGNIALIDGNRLFLFPYDKNNTYWTSMNGTDWDYPEVNPNTSNRVNNNLNQIAFYNYPNPIRNNSTTFRFFNNTGNMDPQINIYNIEGILVETVISDTFQNRVNEYSEIHALLSDYQTGIYFAELIDADKSVAIIKVAIIQ